MKIAEEAKTIILAAMAQNDLDCMVVSQLESCCGKQLNFALGKAKPSDKPVNVDGISMIIDEEILKGCDSLTILAEKGQLFMHDDKPSECGSDCQEGCSC